MSLNLRFKRSFLSNLIINPIGVTTKKNIIPITNGETIFPKKIPNLNHTLFNGFNILNNSTSLREFLIQTKRSSEDIILEMGDKGYLAGIKYSDNEILVAVTEKRTKEQIDNYVQSLMEVDNA